MVEHAGSCHCGAIKFAVSAPTDLKVNECNCSICSKSGYLHLIVPADHFVLLQGEQCLTTYTFNTHTARHLFCKICGIKPFYIPRSHPDGYSVNVRCLDEASVNSIEIRQTNGKEWEKQYPTGRDDYE
ncbi:MAG: GFA family protein [Alteromonadaceae bacterium TMED7]|nr:aldehyde-activating protein [Alteromonadaceae bacterium]MCP4862757.1 GFA family protein [Alteromonas sp.]RPH18081.1 MAG: GFA family protein [Alteromonadaceae bacterium TMED7]|tara:strand:+ start:2653 stop:3036 length:384 start_codon:yes stop_codon:yes gene_type:complete